MPTQTDEQKTLAAALAWAERLERGEEPGRYDPWFVGLAAAYRELKGENERLTTVLGLADVDPGWRDMVDALRSARERSAHLEILVRDLAKFDPEFGNGQLKFADREYKLILSGRGNRLSALIDRARKLLS